MDSENTVTASKKIRFFPTKKQKTLFKLWLECTRWTYNKTIEYLKSIPQGQRRESWQEIRKNTIYPIIPDRFSCVPSLVKVDAVKEACQAYTAAKMRAKKTGQPFSMHWKSRKSRRQSSFICHKSIKSGGIYSRYSGKVRFAELLPSNPRDSRLILENERWFLCVPYKKKTTLAENQGRIVSLDPGVRTFITFYSEDSAGELGKKASGHIHRLCAHLDDLISRTSRAENRYQRRSMRKAQARMRNRIHDLITEMHHKCARFLLDNFDVILLPTFETSEMTSKTKRKIRSKTARQMLTLRHYGFKQHLKQAAAQMGKTVLDVNEAYTSKTCSWSGEIIWKLGGRKIIRGSDGISMSRDMNGARGIYLRALVDSPALFECATT
jgi:putative transposase